MTAPPALVNGKQLRLSWSRLRVHAECRAKGALVAAGKKSPAQDIRTYFPGTVVDRAMGRWLRQGWPGSEPGWYVAGRGRPELGWMHAHVDRILDEEEARAAESGDGIVRWRSAADKEEVRAFCRELVARLERILVQLCLPYEWQPHVRFSVPLEVPWLDGTLRQILLTGEIDLLIRRALHEVGEFDLKATRDEQYWRKVEGQMGFYDICWWGKTGVFPVATALIQPMCKQQVLPFRFSERSRRELFARICTTAMDIFRDDLPPAPEERRCSMCGVKHACPVHKVPAGGGRVVMGGQR